jgi:hypothetical protein
LDVEISQQFKFGLAVLTPIFVTQKFIMKRIIAIICFAAYTTAGIASGLAPLTSNSIVTAYGDKDKDKDKKRKTAKAACCSKGSTEAKACTDSEKSTGKVSSGAVVTPAGSTAAQPKSCCKKDGAAKSCSEVKEKK